MKELIVFCMAAIAGGWVDQQPVIPTRSVSMYDVPLTDRELAMNDPYELDFALVKVGEKRYELITHIQLKGGSFYVSPHSTTAFKGRFSVEFAFYDHVTLDEEFVETPRSKEEIDPHQFVNGPVNWVGQDTRYEHLLTVTREEDFDTGGKYKFVIEPRCTMEEIPFMLKYRSGVLTIEKWGC